MSGNCSSSPLSGCTDGQSIASLEEFSDNFSEHLTTINVKKLAILEQIDDCCESTNGKLTDIVDILETIKTQAIDCCAETNSNLEDVLAAIQTILNGGGPCETNTTTEHEVPVTTEEPVVVTTTSGEPVEVTTTSESETTPTTTGEEPVVVSSDLFELDDNELLICNYGDESEVPLYFLGAWNEGNEPDSIGIQLFREPGLINQVNQFTNWTYIKRSAGVKVYELSELGVAGDYVRTCEV